MKNLFPTIGKGTEEEKIEAKILELEQTIKKNPKDWTSIHLLESYKNELITLKNKQQ